MTAAKSAPTFVDLDNARKADQRAVMKTILEAQECPFCGEHLQKYHLKPILKTGTHWLVTENAWPYDHVKLQFLLIHRDHIEHLTEITPAAAAELVKLLGEFQQEYQIPGGGVALRFGDTNYSAGTVRHLHAQLIWPDIDAPDFEPVRFKIGKNKEKRQS